jgi:hypothetical protein
MGSSESGTRNAISWSVTVYSKKLSSQCNLTAQIEALLDKENQIIQQYKFLVIFFGQSLKNYLACCISFILGGSKLLIITNNTFIVG